jgi:pilus assembly protein CpaE
MMRHAVPVGDDPWSALIVDDSFDPEDGLTGELELDLASARAALGPAASDTVVVFGAGGGVGASVLASGLALARARRDEEVLLVDFDLERGDLAGRWDVPADRTLGDLADVLDELDPRHIDLVAHRDASGVQLVLAPPLHAAASVGAPDAVARLAGACQGRGAVIIDCGSAAAGRAAALAPGATVVVVAHPTIRCARRAAALADALSQWRARRVVMVLNRGCSDDELSTRAFSRAIGRPVLGELPRATADAAAIGAGRWPSRGRRALPTAITSLVDILAA